MTFAHDSQPTISRVKKSTRPWTKYPKMMGRSKKKSRRLFFESLEERSLLAIMLGGIPAWGEQGPRPFVDSGGDGTGGFPVVNSPLNPASGGVESIAINPNNPQQIYVGTVNGGVWRTDNADPANSAATSWTPLTDQLASLGMGDIAFSPLDASGNTVFAGTGTFSSRQEGGISLGGPPIGVLRTTDGGATWRTFALPAADQVKSIVPTAIDLDPGAGVQEMVLAGTVTGGGLYRSNNNGETYTLLSGANGLPAGDISQLIVDPNNSQRFFAAIPNTGIYRGDFNAGTGVIAWTQVNTGLTNVGTAGNIQVTAHDSGASTVLFALLSGPNQGAFRSTNGGGNWTPLAQPPAIFQRDVTTRAGNSIVGDPNADNVAYIATYESDPHTYRYDPSGEGSWVSISHGGALNGTAPHADAREVAIQIVGGTTYLLEADDGGLYLLPNPTDAANNEWLSYNGEGTAGTGLGVTEMYNVAWDSISNIIIGSAQDNGTVHQQTVGGKVWTQIYGADGGDVAVDDFTLAGSNQSIRYFSAQNLGSFRRQVFDNNNAPVGAFVEILPGGGLANFNALFPYSPIELNAIAPPGGQSTRLVVGGSGSSPVYESSDAGTAANPTWTAVPVAAGFGTVTAMTHGGRRNGTDNPDVLYAGDDNGRVYVRSTAGGTLTATTTVFPGATVQDIALDPNDWQHAFVISSTGVWETTNMGGSWIPLTGNLVNSDLRTVEFVENGAIDAVLVGGLGGVFRSLTNAPGVWSEFGVGMPNAVTYDFDVSTTDDILVASTLGRGAFSVGSLSTVVSELSVLTICGDEDAPNQDDIFRLVLDPNNNTQLQVFVNNVLEFTGPIAAISQINVFAAGGNDQLIVDSSNGLIIVPNGIRYDGDQGCPGQEGAGFGGFDRLDLVQTGGSGTGVTDVLAVGATNGSGRSTISTAAGTQRVDFQSLEPVVDSVPAASFSITSIPGLASLLQGDNAINYSEALLIPPPAATVGGRVTVDAFEPIEFTNKDNLIIDAGAGSDVVNLNNPVRPTGATPGGLKTITVNGGDPTASDTLIVNGIAGGQLDNLRYIPTSVGAGTVLNDNAPQPNVLFTGTEHLTLVVQQADGDGVRVDGTTGNDAIEFSHGSTSSSGSFVGTMDQNNATGVGPFTMTPMSYSGISPVANDSDVNFFGAAGTDSFVFNGTAADDSITVTGGEAGGTNFRNTLNGILVSSIEVFNTASALVRGLAGNDTVTLNLPAGPAAATLRVEGGDSDQTSDILNYNAPAGSATTIDFGASTITSVTPAGNPVSFSGIERLNETSSGAGSTLTIVGTAGQDSLAYTPTGATAGKVTLDGAEPVITFTGVGSTFTLDAAGGADAVSVNGTASSDTINLFRSGANTLVQVTPLKTVTLPTANTEALLVLGGLGDDQLNVNVGAGIGSDVIAVPITFDGGAGLDQLSIVGAPATAVDEVIYAPGPDVTRGQLFYENAANVTLMKIEFANLEPVFDSVVAATLRVHGTNSDNVIDYRSDGILGNGRVTVDTYEAIHFTNKTNLILNGFAGSDTISLDNPITPTGLTSITVNGGEPTASDTLIVNGIAGVLDNLRYLPTSVGAGTVINDNQPQPNVLFTGVEHLTLVVQQADGDGVRVDGTTGDDAIEFFHGATSSSGSFVGTMDQNGIQVGVGPFTMTPMSYSGVSPVANDADVNFFNPGGTDSFVFNGTASDDTISVLGGEAGGTDIRNALNGIIASRVEVFNVGSILIRALAGNDAVNLGIPAGNPATFIRVEGGDSDASTDTLNHTAFGGTTTLDLDLSLITATGGNPVSYSGFERVNLTNTSGSLTVNGTPGEDSINFIPSLAGRGSFTASSTGAVVASYPQFVYAMSAASTITINSLGSFDTVGLTATSGNDVVNAVQSTASALSYTQNAFTQPFSVTNLEKVKLSTLGGDDLIRVSVSDTLVATPAASLAFDVDGGPPNASDRLIVNDDGIGDLTILRQSDDQHSGSASVGTLNPVYYDNIERFDVTPVNSITGGVGTDGNGRIDVFHTDAFEYNETRLTAATLSRVSEGPTSPTIDPGAVVAPFAVPGDEDWYEFRPLATGTFAVKILFDLQPTLANGRAGLPGAGDLSFEIYDANGVLITSGVAAPGGKEAIFGATNDPAFPQFNRIFVRVHGTTPDSINHYEFDNLAEIGTGNPGVGNADLFGPQVTDVQANSVPSAVYNLFNSKDAGNALHPTPLTNSLTISFRDFPARAPGFLYPALDPATATTPGYYVVKGDATGIVAISSIILVNNTVVVGGVPTATIQLVFAQPLPDDRFTLTISDHLEDPAGNALDGESNAAEPNGGPTLPSGDGEAGGDFIARFTIDSRAELGAFSAGSVYVDTNGNYLFDPKNTDSTNRDITYLMGFASDNIFAGNFVKAPAGVADGFDKLAAYGKVGANYRWLIDVNNDGVVNGTDVNVVQPLFAGVTSVNGTPVAGNFDGNAANGDEVALKVGNTWLLDKVGHDFKVDAKLVGSNMVGLPIVGDFDGDGIDDLGSWADDKFYLNLSTLGAIDGTADRIFSFGFAGVRERPVAGDFDADGITDLGLWVPDRSGVAPSEAAEWYLLLSGGNTVGTGTSIVTRLAAGGGVINFTPTPFGNDLYAQFGDEFGLPVPGNFDPPLTPTQAAGSFTNSRDKADVDNDGFVSPIDALLIINRLNSGDTTLSSSPFAHAPFVDVNGDGSCAPIDALMVINYLNAQSGSSTPAGEGEGDASADAFFSDLGSSSNDDSLSVLLALDDYNVNRKK